METFVNHRIEDGVGYLTLADPARRNAMTQDIVDQAIAVLDEFAEAGIKVGVLDALGPVFCAGGDLKAKRIPGVPPAGVRLIQAFDDSPLIWFAAVEAPALGAALHLLTTCPRVIMSTSAWLSIPEFLHGRFPRPIVAALAEVIGPRKALRLAMTGERVTAAEALDLGLIEAVVEPGTALETATREAKALAQINVEALENGRRSWTSRLETRTA